MLWFIDSCHNKLSADQYRMTISQAQFRAHWGHMFFWSWSLTSLVVFRLDRRLKPGYYSRGEGGSTCKGKISVQINPWRVVDFSSDIFLHNRLSESPWYIAYVISTILVTLTGYSLLKFNWKNSKTTRSTITSSQLIIFWVSDLRRTNIAIRVRF